MSTAASLQNLAAKPKALSNATHAGLLLQRKCACGSPTSSLTGECAECKSKKRLQTKLVIGADNDPLEQEADRVADQVLAKPSQAGIDKAPLQIQRSTGQTTGQPSAVPASVDHVLADLGRPLDPTLSQDMERRFGHDFSKVRVHSGGSEVEQSARNVNAYAYTVGHSIVFGAGQFSPDSNQGRRLLAHELTHVVQQGFGTAAIQRKPADDKRQENDVNAARYRGQLVAKRIKIHTKLSKEARAKINSELAYFEGAAKEAYLNEVRPALLAVSKVDIEMPAEQVGRRGPPPVKWPSLDPLVNPRDLCGGADCEMIDKTINAPLKDVEERDKAELAQRKEIQLQELRAKTDAWKEDEAFMRRMGEKTTSAWREDQTFAINLLDEILQKNVAPDPRGVSDAIRAPILQRYEAWLRSGDKSAFDEEKGSYAHGPSELLDLERALRLDRNVSDTAVNKVYWEVLEYRKKTDPYWLWTRGYAEAMVSAGVAVVSAVQPDSSGRPAPRTPVNEPAPAPAKTGTDKPPAPPTQKELRPGLTPPTPTPTSTGSTTKRPIGFQPPNAPPATPAPAPDVNTPSRPVAGFGRDIKPSPQPVPAPPGPPVVTQMPRARVVQGSQPAVGSVTPTLTGKQRGTPARAMAGKGSRGDVPVKPEPQVITPLKDSPRKIEIIPERIPTGDDRVWVQLEDGSTRAYNPTEVKGTPARSEEVTTPDGRGKVVGRGEPPGAADVKQPNVQPGGAPAATPTLITPDELNQPIPQAKGASGPKERLTPEERTNANEIVGALEDVNRGNADAINRVQDFRPHEHTSGEFKGWWSVDLRRNNPGALNKMRIYFRKGKNGFEAKVRQYH